MKKISIVGSGLAGSLLSLYLVRRGYQVTLYESRPDPRNEKIDAGRSINLALSCRGITGLAGVGLMGEVDKLMVPMRARAIHRQEGDIRFQAFGRHEDEYINAILRSELNELLLNEAEKDPRIHLNFNMKLIDIDLNKKILSFECHDGSIVQESYDLVIGADGAGSNVRELLTEKKMIKSSRNFLPHGYKELSISKGNSHYFTPEHLHLWPRGAFMLLGNPNRDNSITGSLFLANEGKNSFAELDNEISINQFFKEAFPDAYPAMPNLFEEFMEHPTGRLSNINCSTWYVDDHCLLLGDAAHGVVPFFGQGMNSAFEDCRILNELLDQYEDNWKEVLPAFYATRKINTDAVAALSMDNYHEIQCDINDLQFNLKKQIEQELMHRYPGRYVSKHVLVMFTNTPYSTARAHGVLQTELLEQISSKISSIRDIDWQKVDVLMEVYDKKLTY